MTIPAGDSRMTSPLVHHGVSDHDTLAISSGKKEWYFRSRSTCVAYGTPPEGLCDTSLYVCSATLGGNNKGVYGSQEEQAIMLKVAVENGGVHPDCPRNPGDASSQILFTVIDAPFQNGSKSSFIKARNSVLNAFQNQKSSRRLFQPYRGKNY